ncbi:hypothetical protein D7Z26_01490 [Cohnella endophytica]|uniref:CHY-type domain-containing protein n=1 Tax=Cohnella endophytica TaxID=2419778 RepID=A0A494YDH6_9BACL|nr:hypothetical protein D7Z26_01490 [Cohnella endophytica]
MDVHGHKVCGVEVDNQTRCKHYNSDVDIIAIRSPCCNTYFPCYQCHNEVTDHPLTRWNKNRFDEKAILCGACGQQLTIHEYMTGNSKCPACNASFNEGCKTHYHIYFE